MPDPEISQPTAFQKAVAAAAAVNGQWYFDEYLYRGEPNGKDGGQYKGSHVVVGIDYIDQFGERQTKLYPPMPVGSLPGEVPLGLIFPEAAVAMQRELDARAALIAAADARITELAQDNQALREQLAAATATLETVRNAVK